MRPKRQPSRTPFTRSRCHQRAVLLTCGAFSSPGSPRGRGTVVHACRWLCGPSRSRTARVASRSLVAKDAIPGTPLRFAGGRASGAQADESRMCIRMQRSPSDGRPSTKIDSVDRVAAPMADRNGIAIHSSPRAIERCGCLDRPRLRPCADKRERIFRLVRRAE